MCHISMQWDNSHEKCSNNDLETIQSVRVWDTDGSLT